MANEALLISGISFKVRKLIDVKKQLEQENQTLKQKLDEANVLIKQLQSELDDKRKKLMNTSLANALTNRKSVEEGINYIDELIREIDKGIDVLSD